MTEQVCGKPWTAWYQLYTEKGLGGLENLEDKDKILVLGRCCIGFPLITPNLWKEGWPLERIVAAERAYGTDEQSITLICEEYLALSHAPDPKASLMELRKYLDSSYGTDSLTEKGRSALKTTSNY